MRETLRIFLRAPAGRRGNVAVIFALALLPMIGLVGIGIDTARQISVQTTLAAAADAAALAAATRTRAMLDAAGNTSAAFPAAQLAGQQMGQNVFAVNAAQVGASMGGAPTPTITVSQQGQTIVASTQFSGSLPTAFGQLFGVPSLSVGGTSSASLRMPTYMNISVAIDVSQSMGLGATQQDINNLQVATASTVNGSCAFGCHEISPGDSRSNEQVARSNNIVLRIDVIKTATQDMIRTAQNQAGSTPTISFALYALQGGIAPPLAVIAAPSTNYSNLYTSAGQIDLGPNVGAIGYGDSNFSASMPALTAAVARPGNGSSATVAKQYVFLMTDGVQDVTGACPSTHCTQVFDPSQCTALKNNGVTIGVIYTTYLPMPTNGLYSSLVAPFANQIAPNLQACASPGWYYQASDATDIKNAVNALFAQATAAGVLTQ